MSKLPQVARERTKLELAAHAICRVVYGTCPCERGPSTCGNMERAALHAANALHGPKKAHAIYDAHEIATTPGVDASYKQGRIREGRNPESVK